MAPEPFPALADAVAKYSGDQYSQLRRWQNGYSDCSSFIGKGLKDLGIDPPGASTTADFAVWNQLQEISRSEVTKGDILNKGGVHVVVALDNVNAIGQQRPGRNVQIGKIDGNLMYGATPYKCLRYVGPRPGEDKILKSGFLDLPGWKWPWEDSGLTPEEKLAREKAFREKGIDTSPGQYTDPWGKQIVGGVFGNALGWLLEPNDQGVSPGLRIVMFLSGGALIIIALVAMTRAIGIKAAAPVAKAVIATKVKAPVTQ